MKKRTFDFTLLFREALTESLIKKLYEAGCDDATFGMQFGRSFGTFSRKGSTFREAFQSAVSSVRSAGLNVVGAEPHHFVTQAAIARRTGRTRTGVSLLMNGKRGPGGFPGPWHNTGHAKGQLWRWLEVAQWFNKHNMLPDEDVEAADVIDEFNTGIRLRACIR